MTQQLGNGRPSVSSRVPRRVKRKKHTSLKQIFILSRDALMERKGRSALTILMVLVGGALMVTINGMSEGSAAYANKQLVSLAPNVIFVYPGSNSKIFQEAPGLSTSAPRLLFNGEVVNTIKSLPYVKDVIPGYTAQVQLNVEGNIENANVFATEATVGWAVAPTLTLVPGSSVQNNNPSAMLVGYNIANPPGYTHNPLIRVGRLVG
jgi:putative ABC transport system permease protein